MIEMLSGEKNEIEMLLEKGKKEVEMLSEVGRNVLTTLTLVGVGTQIIREASNRASERSQKNQESHDTDSRINRTAKSGEKVIALAYDDRDNLGGRSIHRGEILTVDSFNRGAYTFQECPADYCPYLGEIATPWYGTESYMLVNDTSRAVVKYLDDIEESTKNCIYGIVHMLEEYKPHIKIGFVISKEGIEILLSEYEAVVLECVAVFSKLVEEQYDVKGFIRGLGGAVPDEDVVINNGWIKGSLQRVCDEVKRGICLKYRKINLMAGKYLIKDITYRFSIEFGIKSRRICDIICNPYMKYIVQSLA